MMIIKHPIKKYILEPSFEIFNNVSFHLVEVFSKKNSSNSHFPKGDGMVVVALNQNLQSKFVLKNAFAQKITVVLGTINMNC